VYKRQLVIGTSHCWLEFLLGSLVNLLARNWLDSKIARFFLLEILLDSKVARNFLARNSLGSKRAYDPTSSPAILGCLFGLYGRYMNSEGIFGI